MSSRSLPREVLKWIQSQDLSVSVKNPKRDFANGYIVAEIFSRYFPQDIKMHSFENATALKRKKDNWEQLSKFFTRRNIPINDDLIEDCLYNRPNSGVNLMEQVYTLLTGKTVKKAPKKKQSNDDDLPAFARPTASMRIKQSMKQTGSTVDSKKQTEKAKSVLEEHNQLLKTERNVDTSRYAVSGRVTGFPTALKQPRKVGKQLSQGNDNTQVQFQQVEIKQLGEKSISELRVKKEFGTSRTSLQSGSSSARRSVSGSGGAGGLPMGSEAQLASFSGSLPLLTVNDLLNGAVESRLGNTQIFQTFDPRTPFFVSFLNNIHELDNELVAGVFNDIVRKDVLVDICLANPKDFWRFVAMMFKPLSGHMNEVAHDHVEQVLCIVGEKMVFRDAQTTWDLFADFALDQLCDLINQYPARRLSYLKIGLSFCVRQANAHFAFVRKLKDSLTDLSTLVVTLSALLLCQPNLNEEYVDLLLYYASLGLKQPSPTTRAASLRILTSVVSLYNSQSIERFLDALEVSAADSWWQVQSELVICATMLLYDYASTAASQAQASSGEAQGNELVGMNGMDEESRANCERMLGVIMSVLGDATQVSSSVQVVALSNLASVIGVYPQLNELYIDNLLCLPDVMRAQLLGRAQIDELGIRILGMHNVFYEVKAVAEQWDAVGMVTALASLSKKQELMNFEVEHVEVLAVLAELLDDNPEDDDTLTEAFDALKDYIYVSFCDEELCEQSIAVCDSLFARLQDRVLPTFEKRLFSVLRMLFPNGPAQCQELVVTWLIQLYHRGGSFQQATLAIVSKLAQMFSGSEPPPVLQDLFAQVLQ